MTRLASTIGRFLGLLLLWWILAGGDPAYWYYGLAAAAVATALSLRVLPPGRRDSAHRARPWEIPGLIVWFVWSAIRGGIDVAHRAFSPTLPIAPHVIRVRG